MRNPDGGADLRQIIAKEKLPITLTALDVDDDDSVHDAFAEVVAEHGSIDILVNNAGIPGAVGGVEEIPFDAFQQVMYNSTSLRSASFPHTLHPAWLGPRQNSSILGRVGNIASIIRRASAGLRECSLTGAMSTLGGCAPGAGAGMSPLTPISGVRAG
jgi:NAD(P)-dependent dehydrogenase (short-subunit alcohol dehydrogenase family)